LIISENTVDATYKAEILALISSLQLQKHVIFVGDIRHEEMPQYYSLADVVVGIPPSDGLPQTLLETMACEVPHILVRLPHYKEIVAHEQSTYFVEISVESIADGITRLLSDTKLRERIAREGLQIVRMQADFQKEVSRVEEKYYELLDSPKRRTQTFVKRLNILLNIILHNFVDARRGVFYSLLGRIFKLPVIT